jgi:dihydropteroate synthase
MSLFAPLPNFTLHHNNKCLELSRPHIMGILNVTPDSFSDGGRYESVTAAVARCEQMIAEGATIIDIGGESTRPNATPVGTEEEMRRVVPVVKAIRDKVGDDIWLSIDTSSPAVIQAAATAGADIWNDVRALKREGAAAMAAKLNLPVMLMHMRGEPDSMDGLDCYDNVVADVKAELQERIAVALAAGVTAEHLIIDPGFGFAKNYQQHAELLTHLDEFKTLGLPLMFGISRKRFLAQVLDNSAIPALCNQHKEARDPVGAAAALLAIQQGASIIRTHNVAMTAQSIALWTQLSEYNQSNRA